MESQKLKQSSWVHSVQRLTVTPSNALALDEDVWYLRDTVEVEDARVQRGGSSTDQ